MADVTEEVLLKIKVDSKQEEAIDDLERLKKTMIGLKEEQASLQNAYKKGHITVSEYAKESVRLEAVMKKTNSAYSETQKKVTGVTSSMDKLLASTQSVAPGATAAAGGMMEMVKASLAFIATPIGAVIAALALAVKSVIAYFKGSAEGQTEWNRIANVGAVILGKVSDAVQLVGEYIVKYGIKPITDWIKVWEGLAKAIGINTDAVREWLDALVAPAERLSKLQEETILLERALLLQRETTAAAVAEAKLKSEDKNLPLKERIALTQQVQKMIKEQGELEIRLAQNKYEIKKQENALSNSTNEDLDEEVRLLAEVYKVRKAVADQQKEAFTKEQALRQEAANAMKKADEDRRKSEEEARALELAKLDADMKAFIDAQNEAHAEHLKEKALLDED